MCVLIKFDAFFKIACVHYRTSSVTVVHDKLLQAMYVSKIKPELFAPHSSHNDEPKNIKNW